MNMCDETAGFRVLCPTRWIVCNEIFCRITGNYIALLELWDTILQDKIVRARVNGVSMVYV